MLPINPGDTIQVSFSPHMGITTATVATVDNLRRQLTVTHATGALSGKMGSLHMDHARALGDAFAPKPGGLLGPVWQ
jgi:hypothetical protein